MKTLLSFLAIFMLLSACTATEETRGNYVFPEDIAAVIPATSTKYDVLRLLGSPTAKAIFDENVWYYIGLKTEKESFFDEKVMDRQTIKVTFTQDKIVESILLVETAAVDVPLNDRITPTSGNEVTVMQQMLGNIGKFNPRTE